MWECTIEFIRGHLIVCVCISRVMSSFLHDERYRQAFKGVLNLRQNGSTSNNDALTYLLRISVFCIQGPITMPRDNARPYLPADDNKPGIRTLDMLLFFYLRDIYCQFIRICQNVRYQNQNRSNGINDRNG